LAYARNRWIPRNDNGKPVNASTVARWIRQGMLTNDGKRIVLEVQYRGNLPMTSQEAVRRFFDAVTAARLERSGSAPSGTGELCQSCSTERKNPALA
jgi:hypothetical protein